MSLPRRVRMREVGLREGLQIMSRTISTEDKLRLIDALSETGVRDIEITSFVRADRVPQMADAEEVVAKFTRREGIRYTALYLNQKGFERGEASGRLDNEAWLYAAVSETFLKKNNNCTFAELLQSIPGWLDAFARSGKPLHGLMLSTAFGCSYEGSIPPARVVEAISAICAVCDRHHASALKEVCLADTMGWGNPELIKEVIKLVRSAFQGIEISLHLHDTRGAGIANFYAGLQEGITIFDASIGGLGGCPFACGAAGNIATEDAIFLCHEMGIETGIDLARYLDTARLVSTLFNTDLPGRTYKVKRST